MFRVTHSWSHSCSWNGFTPAFSKCHAKCSALCQALSPMRETVAQVQALTDCSSTQRRQGPTLPQSVSANSTSSGQISSCIFLDCNNLGSLICMLIEHQICLSKVLFSNQDKIEKNPSEKQQVIVTKRSLYKLKWRSVSSHKIVSALISAAS